MFKANLIIKNTIWLYAQMAITMFMSLYTTRLIQNAQGVVTKRMSKKLHYAPCK